MGIDVRQLDGLADDIGAAGAEALRLADLAVRKVGLDAVTIAQMNSPFDTGYHRGTIGADILGTAKVEVGASSNYAQYLEFGTHKMGARPHIGPAVDAQVPSLIAALEQIGAAL